MDYEVNTIEIKDEMKICPLCEYEDGFHSMFKKDEETLKWLFICPSCHKVFDFGLSLPR